ncbi:MAG: peptide-methionine (S)-S-oxide reductase, partial [Bacteroidota bacterium]
MLLICENFYRGNGVIECGGKTMKSLLSLILVISLVTFAQNTSSGKGKNMEQKLETVTLGAGCFWCVEAIYQRLEGVE